MTAERPDYGFTDDELAALETVYAPELFKDKVVVVSGAGSGIGRGIGFSLRPAGCEAGLLRSPRRAAGGIDGIVGALCTECFAKQMSIREPEAVAEFQAEAEAALGPIDVLINNAGGQFPKDSIDLSVNGWKAVIDTNLNGTWYMMQTAAKRWRETGRNGAIVNIIAVYSRGLPQIAHTCAARAGVAYLSKSVAVEWAPLGIRVNCVAPGAIETTASAIIRPRVARRSARRTRARRSATSRTSPRHASTLPPRRQVHHRRSADGRCGPATLGRNVARRQTGCLQSRGPLGEREQGAREHDVDRTRYSPGRRSRDPRSAQLSCRLAGWAVAAERGGFFTLLRCA